MDTKHGFGALALVATAALAGAGWALQTPDIDAPISMGRTTVEASPADATPGPNLSVLGWPGPEQESDGSAAVAPAGSARNIDGLEAMSATGAATKD